MPDEALLPNVCNTKLIDASATQHRSDDTGREDGSVDGGPDEALTHISLVPPPNPPGLAYPLKSHQQQQPSIRPAIPGTAEAARRASEDKNLKPGGALAPIDEPSRDAMVAPGESTATPPAADGPRGVLDKVLSLNLWQRTADARRRLRTREPSVHTRADSDRTLVD
ncbi:uncharacterized protein PHACADRAFT_253228 [Phanerochaete carnosa HHB-10118-sp]|uniref:Uncharacterized protein n=1 Tax=Phanerochaete carnosa (strain HHB-10118-sp) TaxID=650164 RepID=K5WHY9_PHACS|nr:uncharacterized protein PHACADRAFT_253228 [Phanerochaete carnosa HHB-10118-sp]EKM58734.1 hypothetical protein PHACADRAFT_253228 [Phanerochaete carnosa HHB-10118-sp]